MTSCTYSRSATTCPLPAWVSGLTVVAIQTSPHTDVVLDVMHALLNLTTEHHCQLIVGKHGIHELVDYARAGDSAKMRVRQPLLPRPATALTEAVTCTHRTPLLGS